VAANGSTLVDAKDRKKYEEHKIGLEKLLEALVAESGPGFKILADEMRRQIQIVVAMLNSKD
jgi:hypothetical protein